MSHFPRKMTDKMKEVIKTECGIDPFSCVVIDKDKDKEERVFVNEDFIAAGPPKIDLASGTACTNDSMEFRGNPVCWEYRCGRYGCFWYPYPC